MKIFLSAKEDPLVMKYFVLLAVLLLAGLSIGCHQKVTPLIVTAAEALHHDRDREFRATWVATALNLDWPPSQTLRLSSDSVRITKQQQALLRIVDEARELNLNAIIFQVKPDGGVLWPSSILPWSSVLTGQTGRFPGFDPLNFLINAAHRYNIEVHAWLNPYRITFNNDATTWQSLVAPSGSPTVYSQHPTWIRSAGGRLVLDPGLPEVRDLLVAVVRELLGAYEVDGIHLDDYFYYETANDPLDDHATFSSYPAGFINKGDWRRNNTFLLIRALSSSIRSQCSRVKFGVSPAGVWRNQLQDPLGSATHSGHPTYDTAYADTRLWLHAGLLDYIVPQIYWSFENQAAPYGVVATWWVEQVAGQTLHLYIGNAVYKVGTMIQTDPGWARDTELQSQLIFNRATSGIDGSVLFRHTLLCQPSLCPSLQDIRKTLWTRPALIPSMPWKTRNYLSPPTALSRKSRGGIATLSWKDTNRTGTLSYALYYVSPGWPADHSTGELLTTLRHQNAVQYWQDIAAARRPLGRYVITALDGNYNESPAAIFP